MSTSQGVYEVEAFPSLHRTPGSVYSPEQTSLSPYLERQIDKVPAILSELQAP